MKIEIYVEVKLAHVTQKGGISRDGKRYNIREQFGYVDMGKPYPVEVKIPLEQDAPAYPPGHYMVDPGCIYIDRYGQIALGRIKLIPSPADKAA